MQDQACACWPNGIMSVVDMGSSELASYIKMSYTSGHGHKFLKYMVL